MVGGEGMGAWFEIKPNGAIFTIKRWTEAGVLESDGDFKLEGNQRFNHQVPYKISYPSNSQVVVVIQNEKEIRLAKIELS